MMKKVFKTLSAILLATACLTPGLAWAATPSITLESNGSLKASDMADVHSVLVEVAFDGANADKVTGVELKNAPNDALSSAVFSGGRAIVALSAGENTLNLTNSSLGDLSVIANGASAENPVPVSARITTIEYIDSADSTVDTKTVSVNAAAANLTSTQGEPVNTPGDGSGADGLGNGLGDGWNADGFGDFLGDGMGSDADGLGADNANANATRTADYRATGVVSNTQAGQSTADTSLVKTGDVLMICGIGLGVAALAVGASMFITRRKASREE